MLVDCGVTSGLWRKWAAGAGEIWIVSSPARGARASEAESILCKRVTELARAARTTPCIKPASVHRRAQQSVVCHDIAGGQPIRLFSLFSNVLYFSFIQSVYVLGWNSAAGHTSSPLSPLPNTQIMHFKVSHQRILLSIQRFSQETGQIS